MRTPILRACLICGTPTSGSRCAAHAYPTNWQNHQRAYTHKDTQARRVLIAKHSTCQCSGWCGQHSGPCRQASTERDHILNVMRGGTDDPTNTQALCSECHRVKTQAESHLGRKRKPKS